MDLKIGSFLSAARTATTTAGLTHEEFPLHLLDLINNLYDMMQ
ncbi:hypothetical protein RHABOEDO_001527 [Candidatus Rhabdochlamydia oedothoracis]|uniref:Uncharacterized protein n=1 Tax=Candidatus Rhabdochlamydia oedothoracis TaxID=2720720 RepID=A0ABX8V1W4_9BACT|nr:hypothetical protein [Candidatus Rhabdochlamydia sp. W815]KAG6558547.1 hypothetical protein RHOW815_001464 [Candidatus Rhabdochlamydia sp. W815]QYF49228.1 hypothetical protein RHABOEDO_001527 [Candidatus Rhabdochlamydia oedothoracis]